MSIEWSNTSAARAVLLLIGIGVVALVVMSGGGKPGEPPTRDETSSSTGIELPGSADGDPPPHPLATSGAPTGTGRIHGVVRRDGIPVAAAMTLRFVVAPPDDFSEIWLTDPTAGTPIASTTADAEGRYHFPGVGPGLYEVEALTGEVELGYHAVYLSPGYDRRRVDVDISTGGHVLEGLARWADGRPYRGGVGLVDVEDGMQLYTAFGRPSAETDEEGRFRIRGIPPGRYFLGAGPAGTFRSYSKPIAVPHSGEVRFVLDEGLREVPGRVVSSTTGDPLAGLKVLASGHAEGGRDVYARLVTNADGRFKARIPGTFLHIVAFHPGYCPVHEHFEDPAGPIEVRLDPDARITGRVLSAGTGKPVAGAVVRWRPGGNRYHRGSGATVSDVEGRYELTGVPAMEVRLYVRGGGWISESMAAAEKGELEPCVVPPGGALERDLTVVAAGRALVRVRDADGGSVSRAVVLAEHDRSWFEDHALGFDEEKDLFGITGEDGTVILNGLRPGVPYDITVRADDGPAGVATGVVAFARQQVEVEIEIPRPRWVEVLVLDAETSEPVSGAIVGIGVLEDEWTTDARGIAIAGPFADREMEFTFRHPHYFRPKDNLEVPVECRAVRVELKRGAVITGSVRFSDGRPCFRAQVHARESEDGSYLADGTTADDGGFELTPLPDGTVHVRAVAWQDEMKFAATMKVEAGRRDVVLILAECPPDNADEDMDEVDEDELPIVRVVGPGGLPVPRASAQLFERRPGRVWFYGTRLGGGRLAAEGAQWIVIHSARKIGGEPLPFGTAFIGPIDDPSKEIAVRLPEERSIEGKLLDEHGRPVPDVRVRAVPVYTEFLLPLDGRTVGHDETVTVADGSFRLGRLGNREYRLVVDRPGRFAEGPAPTARAGARDVTIRLRPAARPLLTVLDPDGEPVPGTRILARSSSRDWETTALTDADGRVHVTGLDPDGSYGLIVAPPKGREDVVPLVLPGWRPAEETLRLPLPLTIRGVVRLEDGKTVYTRIFYQGVLDEHPRRVMSDGDGTFEILGLSPGTYRLRATEEGPEVPVAAGTTDVVLVRPE